MADGSFARVCLTATQLRPQMPWAEAIHLNRFNISIA
jgi:hypothetical protein